MDKNPKKTFTKALTLHEDQVLHILDKYPQATIEYDVGVITSNESVEKGKLVTFKSFKTNRATTPKQAINNCP